MANSIQLNDTYLFLVNQSNAAQMELGPDESLTSDVFVTPTKRNIVSGSSRRKLFSHTSVSKCLFEPNNVTDLLRVTGKTEGTDISQIKSPLKRLIERNFNTNPGEILPKHSKSIEGEYFECKFKEGEFTIPKEEWLHIFKNGRLIPKRYLFLFTHLFYSLEFIKICCLSSGVLEGIWRIPITKYSFIAYTFKKN